MWCQFPIGSAPAGETTSGVYARLDGDKEIKTDAVAYSFNRLRDSKGVWVKGKSFRHLRSTSETLLQNGGYDHLVNLFLGHAARTTADRAYAANYDNRLDEAIEYLRQAYLCRCMSSERGTEQDLDISPENPSKDCHALLTA